jgi:hypothetical protein
MANPGNYSTQIKATTETAFQRAIILGEASTIDKETVEWLDIELPVDKHRKARGHCVDLIGRSQNGYIICELKFGKNSATDYPSFAKEELERCRKDIEFNCKHLDNSNTHHKNGKPFKWEDIAKNSRYIIAANQEYWDYWLGHRKEQLPEGVDCYSIDIDVSCFKHQKGNNENYTPTIPQCNWEKLNR